MAGLFSDARKTALGAVALAVVALWFTDQGGLGGEAVVAADAAGHAHRQQADEEPAPKARPGPTAAPAGWSAAEDEDDVEPAPTEAAVAPSTEPENPPE